MHCAPIKIQKQLCIVTFTEEPLAIDIWTYTDACNAPLLMLTREGAFPLSYVSPQNYSLDKLQRFQWQRARGEALCKVF
jgi:hypothetical protein